MSKPRKHASLIKEWANGAEIQLLSGVAWVDIEMPTWSDGCVYRVNPDYLVPTFEDAYERLYELAIEDIQKAEMNLRDQIAIALLPTIRKELKDNFFFKDIAKNCYALADEMLKYRGE